MKETHPMFTNYSPEDLDMLALDHLIMLCNGWMNGITLNAGTEWEHTPIYVSGDIERKAGHFFSHFPPPYRDGPQECPNQVAH